MNTYLAIRISPLLLAALLPAQVQADAAATKAPEIALADANNAFGCDLYRILGEQGGNLFFSPYSVSVALGMTRAGAAGATAREMDEVLHTLGLGTTGFAKLRKALTPRMLRRPRGQSRTPSYELHVANALWGQIDIKFEEPFLATMSGDFDAPFQRIDFKDTEAARRRINAWVEQQTKKRIKDIVPPGLLTPDSLLALGNAIYFKASWAESFKERATRLSPFTTADQKIIEVSMMARTGQYPYAENDDAQVIEIPYRGGDTSMVLILPKKVDGLPALEARLTAKRLASVCGLLKRRTVALKMPKFKFTMFAQLGEPLTKMGIKTAFTARANFSKMTKAKRFMISKVLHKAFVALDEHGTEAAAATIVPMKIGGRASANTVSFTADHPYMFLIRHRKTGCVLFMGRMNDPRSRSADK